MKSFSLNSDSTVKKQLTKSDKLRYKSDFEQVRLEGIKLVGHGFLLVYLPTPNERPRCGVICSKKYSLLSVKRNRARRLCWESFRLLKECLPNVRLVIIPRRNMQNYKRQDVLREMAVLLIKAKVIPASIADFLPEC